MKTGIKVLIGALAFVVTNAYAAEFMTKLEFEKVESQYTKIGDWIGPYISIHFLSLNPLLVRRRRYSRGERYPSALCGCHSL